MTFKKKGIIPAVQGFTLIELMVAMAIFSIATVAIWSSFTSQNTVYQAQEQVAKVQQNIRGALHVMEKELRMAGYPRNRGFGIEKITGNTLEFSFSGEGTIEYSMDGSILKRNNDPLARGIYKSGSIEGFFLAYAFDDNGDGNLDTSPNGHIIWAIDTGTDNKLDLRLDTNDDGEINAADADGSGLITGASLPTSVDTNKIRAVRIWILAQAEKPDRNYHDNNTYVVGRHVITADDRVRKRLLTTIVKCRNL